MKIVFYFVLTDVYFFILYTLTNQHLTITNQLYDCLLVSSWTSCNTVTFFVSLCSKIAVKIDERCYISKYSFYFDYKSIF